MKLPWTRNEGLLNAVLQSARALLRGPDPTLVLAEVLAVVGRAAGASRAHVFTFASTSTGPLIATEVQHWEAKDFAVSPINAMATSAGMAADGFGSWIAELRAGRTVSGKIDSMDPQVREVLHRNGVRVTLVVPIMIDGDWWGQIGFDNCTSDEEWTLGESDSVRTLAELIGGALAKMRRLAELSDAQRIIDNSPVMLFRFGPTADLPLLYISDNVRRYGHDAAEVLKSPSTWLQALNFHPDDIQGLANAMRGIIDGTTTHVSREYRTLHKDGSVGWFDSVANGVYDSHHHLVALEGIAIDVTERKDAERRLTTLARTDALSGLGNRIAFVEALRPAIARAMGDGTGLAVFYLDLDHFHDINDTLGHQLGDDLLQAVARRLRTTVREVDMVARFSGDEFAVIGSDIAEPADAALRAERLLEALRQPFSIEGHTLHCTTSIGIALLDASAPTAEAMLSHADIALYRAKSEDGDTFRFFAAEMDEKVRTRVTLAAELRVAIAQGQLFLLYQPQVDTRTRGLIGVEALVRWNHPGRGLMQPDAFIPVAEQSGLIVGLGDWVLREACRQIRAWLDDGLDPCLVAVNVSGKQLKAPNDLERDVAAALADERLTPNRIELELTETVLMQTSRLHNDILLRLRRTGLRLAIDDFGTGYSSLEYLRQFPVDRIKIAQNFMKDIETIPGNKAIVNATIGLARTLNMKVIAEGVENQAQLDLLVAWGCHEVQGFYFARPLSHQQIATLLRDGGIMPSTAVDPGEMP